MSEAGQPPSPVEASGFFTGLRALPIVVGVFVDNLATMLGGLLFLSAQLERYGIRPGDELPEEVLRELHSDPTLLAASLVIGILATSLGGYAAGRMAHGHRRQHGAFVGLVGVLLGLLAYGSAVAGERPPLWYDLLGFLLMIPAGALGGALAELRSARTPKNPAEPPFP
ncbi:MAG: TIGR04086 family membrane protein [Myxococcales bacterium]|nr:TIGR04086 family membrane protein [Myxococcales bacterium]